MAEEADVIRAGAELVIPETGQWLRDIDITGPLIVLVHGFTSQGKYLHKLAAYLRSRRFVISWLKRDVFP